MDACKEKMTKQAEDAVKELILVYTLADVYGDAVELTKEQKKLLKALGESLGEKSGGSGKRKKWFK